MFRTARKHILILSFIALDLLLVLDIKQNLKNNPTRVLGTQTVVKERIHVTKKSNRKPPVINSVYIAKKYPSLTPTKTPTPAPSPSQNPSNQTLSSNNSTNTEPSANNSGPNTSASVQVLASSNSSSLLGQINDFRASKGKPRVSENSETCSFASTRASEITSAFNHDGFRNRIDSKTLPYPSYSQVAENIAMNGDANKVVPGWINSSGHAENMLKDVPYGCVRNSGNYYVFEAWKP